MLFIVCGQLLAAMTAVQPELLSRKCSLQVLTGASRASQLEDCLLVKRNRVLILLKQS